MKVIIVLLIGMVCLLGSSAFSAGGNINRNLSERVTLPGLLIDYSSSNYASFNWDENSQASIYFTMDNSIFGSASWNFYVYPDDPSKWKVNMYLNGWYLGDGVIPDSFEKNQNSSIDFSDVYLSSYLDIDYFQEDASIRIYGNYSIAPAIITSTNLRYDEYEDPWQDLTRWNVNYDVRGYFVADSLAEAQAMGAPFVAIPEPATMILFGLGVPLLRLCRKR